MPRVSKLTALDISLIKTDEQPKWLLIENYRENSLKLSHYFYLNTKSIQLHVAQSHEEEQKYWAQRVHCII